MDVMHKDIMESYNNYLLNIPNGCQQIVNHIRENKIQEALGMILDFSEGVNWLVDVNQILKFHGISKLLEVEKIHDFLEEINNGLAIHDFLLVADLFEYEIMPFFEQVEIYEVPVN
ncbi:hypothetical protein MHI22_19670 [Lysinibacillus sp. FSL L8-0312]|uniref:hypothetical protein n=1 Tax=Lysinibacillus sp. FSL L8-0312 TaxID=2921521 RepID=UPI0030F88DF0